MLPGMLLSFISDSAFAKIGFCQKFLHIRGVCLLKLHTIPGSSGEGHRPPGRLSPNSPQQGGNTGGPTRLGLPGSLQAPPRPTLSWVCHRDGLSWMDESPQAQQGSVGPQSSSQPRREEGWRYLPSFTDRKKRNHLIWVGGRGLWRILTGLRYMPPLRPGVMGTMTVAPCRTPRLGGCSGRGTVLQMGMVFPLDRGGSRQNQRTDIYGRQRLRE